MTSGDLLFILPILLLLGMAAFLLLTRVGRR